MTKAEIRKHLLELSESDRLELADAVWASLENPDALELPAWQRELLDERLSGIETEEGRDWEDVRAEIWPPSKKS